MNETCMIEFRSRDCKNYVHNRCDGTWHGLGYDIICDCVCHKKKDLALVDRCQPSTVPVNELQPLSLESQKEKYRGNEMVKIKGMLGGHPSTSRMGFLQSPSQLRHDKSRGVG